MFKVQCVVIKKCDGFQRSVKGMLDGDFVDFDVSSQARYIKKSEQTQRHVARASL